MKRGFYLLLVVSILLASCTPSSLSPVEYARWIEKKGHGACIDKTIGDYQFKLQYKPLDYIVLNENKGKVTAIELRKRKVELEGMQYYTLQIKNDKENELMSAGISKPDEYFERLEYMTSNMQDDLSLVIDNDTLPCRLFHYERSYGISPWNNFLLGFDNSKPTNKTGKRILIYRDQLLGTGKVIISLNESDLESIPQLKI